MGDATFEVCATVHAKGRSIGLVCAYISPLGGLVRHASGFKMTYIGQGAQPDMATLHHIYRCCDCVCIILLYYVLYYLIIQINKKKEDGINNMFL
jgi:hypothetical protein